MKLNLVFLGLLFLGIGCGSGSAVEIAGVDASQGCGEFDDNDAAIFTLTENTCPFNLNETFRVKQNGCVITLESLATDGSDIFGVVNENGTIGIEIVYLDTNDLYECIGYSGYWEFTCLSESGDNCQIEARPTN